MTSATTSALVVAHLSDTHLDGSERALARTRAVMDQLRALPVDAILVTGDIADHGDPGRVRAGGR